MRVLVVLPSVAPSERSPSSLGSRASVEKSLRVLNTQSDSQSVDILYGPGIQFQLAPNQDPVVQMLLEVSDEDIGWLVIERIGRTLKWKFVDINTGNEISLNHRDSRISRSSRPTVFFKTNDASFTKIGKRMR